MVRRIALALGLAALAASLAACGAGVKSAVDPVAAAATKSAKSGGYAATMTMKVGVDGKETTMTATGSFDQDRGEMNMDMSGLFGRLGAPAGTDTTASIVYDVENGDPVMYMRFGFLAKLLPQGKTWVKIDLEQAGKAAGIDFSQLLGGATQSPTQGLDMLRSAGDFTNEGSETIDGVQTTHYHGTIDLEKIAASGGPAASAVQRLIQLGAPTSEPMDVWIDGSGFVRQFEESYTQTIDGTASTVDMTMTMSDYGGPVQITVPPPDQVLDGTSLATQGLKTQLNPGPTA